MRSSFVPPHSEKSRRYWVTPSGTYADQSSGSLTGNGITCTRMPSSSATASTMRRRSTYVNGFDSGRWRSGSLGSSLTRWGSGLVIPTNTSSERSAAPRRYSRCPLWKGWNRPWIIPEPIATRGAAPWLEDENPGAFLHASDSADEELASGELGFERGSALGGDRDEQAARGLRVVAERLERVREAGRVHVGGREVAVARVAAGPNRLPCKIERTVDRREALRLEPQGNAAASRHLVRMPEETEAGHVGDRIRFHAPQHVGGILVQRPHPANGSLELHLARKSLLVAGHDQTGSERLREEQRVSRLCAVLRPDPVRMDHADDGEAVLRLGIANRVPAREECTGCAYLFVGRRED